MGYEVGAEAPLGSLCFELFAQSDPLGERAHTSEHRRCVLITSPGTEASPFPVRQRHADGCGIRFDPRQLCS